MSGRIRSLKPELLEDAKTAGLSNLEFRLFVSALLMADDYGNLRATPKLILGTAFWSVEESASNIAEALVALHDRGLFQVYSVRDQSYAHICGWEKHQKVDKPGKPRVPGPSESFVESSRDSRETLATDLRPPTSDLRPPRGTSGACAHAPVPTLVQPAEPPADNDSPAPQARIAPLRPPPFAQEPSGMILLPSGASLAVPESKARPAASQAPESGYDLAKRIWSELWSQKYKEAYIYSPRFGQDSEDKVLQRVGGLAIEQGGERAEEYMRHWVTSYLRGHGKQGLLDEKRHPLSWLDRELASFGHPRQRRQPAESDVRVRSAPKSDRPPPATLASQAEYARRLSALGIAK